MIFICILLTCLLQIVLRYLIKYYNFNNHLNTVVLVIALLLQATILPVLLESEHNNPIAVGTNLDGLFVFLQFWFIGIPASIITHFISRYYLHEKQSN